MIRAVFFLLYMLAIVGLNRKAKHGKIVIIVAGILMLILLAVYSFYFQNNLTAKVITQIYPWVQVSSVAFFLPLVYGSLSMVIRAAGNQNHKLLISVVYLLAAFVVFYMWHVAVVALTVGLV
ncbi:hypothetical protein [Enterococcus sp. AZ109]|uniref:hypothetical protein n=1 Tax=Enterococcus sp. AZ109 TaxID=2774634 RepID=UPI003F2247FB